MPHNQMRSGVAVAVLLTVVCYTSAALTGCKTGPSNAPPSVQEATAFKGAPPTAGDREAMKKEEAAAAEYRRTHPKEFPPETTPAPNM